MDDRALRAHMEEDARFQARFERMILGDKETGEIGMKQKVDAMYEILVQAKGVSGFFGGIKGILGLVIVIAAVVTIFKGWFKV